MDKAQSERYRYTTQELPHALVWGKDAGIAAHDMVKAGERLNTLDLNSDDEGRREQAHLRVEMIEQNTIWLVKDWRYSGSDAHKKVAREVAEHAAALKVAVENGVRVPSSVRKMKGAIARFSKFTIREAKKINARLDGPNG